MTRSLAAAAVAFLSAIGLAACGGGTPADGFQLVGTGDTYGEWELFAEVRDGEWTGCLRFDHGKAGERCADPVGLVKFEFQDVIFGASPEDGHLVFADDGGDVTVLVDDLDLPGYDFFVVAGEADVKLEG